MMSNECELINAEMENLSHDDKQSPRPFITARRRSLSGSAVATRAVNRKLHFGFKNDKSKFKANGQASNRKMRFNEYVR